VQQSFPVDLLGCQQRKTFGQIDLVVRTEIRNRVDARATFLEGALFEDKTNQVEVLSHAIKSYRRAPKNRERSLATGRRAVIIVCTD